MGLSGNDITILFLMISVMLFFARGLGELIRKFKQPMVIGEILAGIILGPTILGWLFPGIYNYLFVSSSNANIVFQGITILGVTMLLLVSGLEVDLTLAIRQGKSAMLISLMGIIFPFSVGFAAAYFFPEQLGIINPSMHLIFAAFVGVALSISALPVVAKTLMDLNIFKTDVGRLIIASAMFDDLIGWIAFSFILAAMHSTSRGFNIGTLIPALLFFIVFTLLIGRKIINYFLPILEKRISYPGGILNFILILGFLCAAFTEHMGIHAIFGAFIIGVAIGDSVHLKEQTREIIQQFVTNIFAPLFFVSIGLHINFIRNFDLWIVLTFLVLAFIGKVIGCGLGAYFGGMNKEDSLAIGFGMNSRGAMEIVLGILALQAGLIHEKVFVALVIMALFTSISSAPLMSFLLKKSKKKLSFIDLLKQDDIVFTDISSKEAVIKELSRFISLKNRISEGNVFAAVMEREAQLSTGLANYLAIPHARINIQYPLIAAAVNKNGIEFNSLDGLPAKFIIILLTPLDNPELQLKLLAEISKSFRSIDKVNDLINSENPSEIISKLKQLS